MVACGLNSLCPVWYLRSLQKLFGLLPHVHKFCTISNGKNTQNYHAFHSLLGSCGCVLHGRIGCREILDAKPTIYFKFPMSVIQSWVNIVKLNFILSYLFSCMLSTQVAYCYIHECVHYYIRECPLFPVGLKFQTIKQSWWVLSDTGILSTEIWTGFNFLHPHEIMTLAYSREITLIDLFDCFDKARWILCYALFI